MAKFATFLQHYKFRVQSRCKLTINIIQHKALMYFTTDDIAIIDHKTPALFWNRKIAGKKV